MNIYQTALSVLGAGNATGVILSMADVAKAVRDDLEARGESLDTEHVNKHPALVLFTHKLTQLCGLPGPSDWTYFHNAYDICMERASAQTKH